MLIPDDTTKFKTLETIIRYGKQPNSPTLLYHYLRLGEQQAKTKSEFAERQMYLGMFNTLMNTICDTCVAYHWRNLCLDHVYKPLFLIERLIKTQADQRQVKQLYRELKTLSHYFL
ncbi:hypothetical protein [Aliikangiella coralliicola]|uniref:Uncharacterized protein n=1 Tax=Aliikangiella coralliicola TaxID=2592383 RepID=A0A545UCI2_9GAMM|nr:hypothetical protein [Aliikangiella coralliicola]TQV87133.1 hypothetical protein FLL46_15115 [Aliikangiella coralliicola]